MYGESGNCFLQVSWFNNGFTVRVMDPGIVKYNKMRDKKNSSRGDKEPYLEYKEPWKSFVFADEDKMKEFIAKNLSKAATAAKSDGGDTSEYETAWNTAVATPEK